MDGNCRESDGPTHTPDGKFAPGNQLGGSRLGVPNKVEAIRQAVMDTFDLEALEKLKTADPRTYWSFFAKMMPHQVQAEVGGMGSIGAECQAALREAGITNGKTRLGTLPSEDELNAIRARHDNSSGTS